MSFIKIYSLHQEESKLSGINQKLLMKIYSNVLGKNLGLGWGMYSWQRKQIISAIT